MKRLALALTMGALLFLAAPAPAHEWRGGTSSYSYPSSNGHGYYQTYNSGHYRPYNSRYFRPTVIFRQGPPYGWAWGQRRTYPARYRYDSGHTRHQRCDNDGNGWWGGHQNQNWNGGRGRHHDKDSD